MNIAYFGYRKWAFAILDNLLREGFGDRIKVIGAVEVPEEGVEYSKYENLRFITDKKNEPGRIIHENKIDIAFFYGWSWIVPDEVVEKYICVCLHPALLPRYRGGSPFQHQIINGEKEGGLTLFKMDRGIDAGPIAKQKKFSLEGKLSDIFSRVIASGTEATIELIRDFENGSLVFSPQKDLEKFPAHPRRKLFESEVSRDELAHLSREHFYNFVRALDDPYPNCTIRFPGKEEAIRLQEVEIVTEVPSGAIMLNESPQPPSDAKEFYIKLKDGFAKAIRFAIIKLHNA